MDEEKHVRRDFMDWVDQAAAAPSTDAVPPPPAVKVESKDSDVRSLLLTYSKFLYAVCIL